MGVGRFSLIKRAKKILGKNGISTPRLQTELRPARKDSGIRFAPKARQEDIYGFVDDSHPDVVIWHHRRPDVLDEDYPDKSNTYKVHDYQIRFLDDN